MPIGPNAVTHMAEAKREVIIQDTDTIFNGYAQKGNSLGRHAKGPRSRKHGGTAAFDHARA